MKKEIESNGRKESVKIRERHLSDGTISLYLDILHNGKRSREFLKLYLFEGNSREIKERTSKHLPRLKLYALKSKYNFKATNMRCFMSLRQTHTSYLIIEIIAVR